MGDRYRRAFPHGIDDVVRVDDLVDLGGLEIIYPVLEGLEERRHHRSGGCDPGLLLGRVRLEAEIDVMHDMGPGIEPFAISLKKDGVAETVEEGIEPSEIDLVPARAAFHPLGILVERRAKCG